MKYPRRGITLMEVLISIFVASVGLMGLAALIPVGRHYVVEASKQERGNAVGRAAFREIKVRGWLRPDMWVNHSLVSPTLWFDPLKTISPATAPAPILRPDYAPNIICIDPLYVSQAMATAASTGTPLDPQMWPGRYLPFALDNDPVDQPVTFNVTDPMTGVPTPVTWIIKPPRFLRATLRSWANGPQMPYPAADRLFRSGDDLVFELPGDETKRPNVVWGADDRTQSAGDYTWLATAKRISDRTYLVSVVVFYKRGRPPVDSELYTPNIANRSDGPPAERTVYADSLSGGVGFGGGDLRLRLPVTPGVNDDAAAPEKSDFIKVRPGQWIMLSGWTPEGPTWPPSPVLLGWYRVVSAASEPVLVNNDEWQQEITVSGADIAIDTTAFRDSDIVLGAKQSAAPTIYAGIIDGVVGVYTKTIEVDSWAQ